MYSRLSSFTKWTVLARLPLPLTSRNSAVSIRLFGQTADVSSSLPASKPQDERRRREGSAKSTQRKQVSSEREIEVSVKNHLRLTGVEDSLVECTTKGDTVRSQARAQNASNGTVRRTFPDGAVYVGGLNQNRRHGQGKHTTAKGQVLEGEWKDGKIYNGTGLLVHSNGAVQEGTWVEGKLEGRGKEITTDGYAFTGSFHNGAKHGLGVLTYPDGGVYEGDFQDNKRHGQGKYVSAEKIVYEGGWVDGKKQGQGKETYADKTVYEGSWVEGKKHGPGKQTSCEGRVLEGGRAAGREREGIWVVAVT